MSQRDDAPKRPCPETPPKKRHVLTVGWPQNLKPKEEGGMGMAGLKNYSGWKERVRLGLAAGWPQNTESNETSF